MTSTTGCCFRFGSISSFFLQLFLHWPPVAYWAPTDLGSTSFSVLSFRLFMLIMGFSRQEYWSCLPFPSPVDHILSELSKMTCPCLALHCMAHCLIELDKAVVHVSRLVSFCDRGFQSVSPRRRIRGLWKLPKAHLTSHSRIKIWSTGEGNGEPLQYSCLENPMNNMKRKKR